MIMIRLPSEQADSLHPDLVVNHLVPHRPILRDPDPPILRPLSLNPFYRIVLVGQRYRPIIPVSGIPHRDILDGASMLALPTKLDQ